MHNATMQQCIAHDAWRDPRANAASIASGDPPSPVARRSPSWPVPHVAIPPPPASSHRALCGERVTEAPAAARPAAPTRGSSQCPWSSRSTSPACSGAPRRAGCRGPQVVEVGRRHLREVGLVPDAVAVRNGTCSRPPRSSRLMPGTSAAGRRSSVRGPRAHERRRRPCAGNTYSSGRNPSARVCRTSTVDSDAPVPREVRVASALGRLPVPDHVQRHVRAAQPVGDERVAEVLEPPVLHVAARAHPGNPARR